LQGENFSTNTLAYLSLPHPTKVAKKNVLLPLQLVLQISLQFCCYRGSKIGGGEGWVINMGKRGSDKLKCEAEIG
jgi:hypothetical protein